VARSIAATTVRGRWFKHAHPGSPPLPWRSPPPDNRWQRGNVVDALYLADSDQTAWAEWYRHLAERMIPPLAQMPRVLWTWEVDVEVADLSTTTQLAAAGLHPPTPGRETWPSCQDLGERLAREGFAGLITPSAARPEGMVLCLFRDKAGIAGAKPLPPARLVAQPPPPPTGLRT
jgi:RES domain-containing protein